MANGTESPHPAPIPAPAPTAETNQTNYSPTNLPSEIDLDKVWQQVLNRVRPNGTQSLLRQHGQLIIFSNDSAYVKISSQPLLKMVKDKVSNIQEAFAQIFNRQVTVKLGVTNPAKNNSSPVKDLPASNKPVAENPRNSHPVSDANQQVQQSPNPEIFDNFSRNDRAEQKHPPAAENTAVNVPEINDFTGYQNELNARNVAVRADARSVANTSRQWADMFEGEVVDLSDDLEIWESASVALETEAEFPELSSELEPDDFIDW
ncbi:hypothetical protein IQ252_28240 [Tychonema sp. LEGE 07203]|nr:hypothetical protein [Tychonema sp. LEGE 07203]